MGLLTREALLAASGLASKTVPVPEWGGEIVLGEMSGVDRDDWDAGWIRREAAEKAAAAREKRAVDPTAAGRGQGARLVVWCARDGAGGDLFPIRRPDGRIDHDAVDRFAADLDRKGQRVLARLAAAAQDVNGWGTGAVEAAAGNSGGTSPG